MYQYLNSYLILSVLPLPSAPLAAHPHRLGIKPLEMDKKEYLNVSTCSPDDVHLFRRNILRDDLFEPFPKAVPFNESPAASIDLSEIAYSELSPGTCSTGDTMPCLGIVVFKGGRSQNNVMLL